MYIFFKKIYCLEEKTLSKVILKICNLKTRGSHEPESPT